MNLKTGESPCNPYNEEPVMFCKQCLSLSLRTLDGNSDITYCDKCGSTEIEEADIFTWRAKYKEKYKKDFIDNGGKNGKQETE